MAKHTANFNFLDPILDTASYFPQLSFLLIDRESIKAVNFNDCLYYQFAFFANIERLRWASDIIHFIALLQVKDL
jgi:hypothetical protein